MRPARSRRPALMVLSLCALYLCAIASPCLVRAQALRLPPPPPAQFAPPAGARLPLDLMLRDERGAAVRLGALTGPAPVVLVPGYYTCPHLCTTLFASVVQTLALSGLPADAYRLVGVSIDPRDHAADASARRSAFAAVLPGGGAGLTLLTGDAASLSRLEQALGYRAVRDPASGELAHAAGFVVADATGRITRYFAGVSFDPAELRGALQAARGGGTVSLGQRLLLLCTHDDPAVGRHSAAALTAVRAGVLLVLGGIGIGAWRRRRGGAREP